MSEVSAALCMYSTCGFILCCAAEYPASTVRDGRHSVNGRAYPAITRAMISAPVQAMICPIPLHSPVAVWNDYVKLAKATRQRRRARIQNLDVIRRIAKHLGVHLAWIVRSDCLHKPLNP